jgi:hypothetical protein
MTGSRTSGAATKNRRTPDQRCRPFSRGREKVAAGQMRVFAAARHVTSPITPGPFTFYDGDRISIIDDVFNREPQNHWPESALLGAFSPGNGGRLPSAHLQLRPPNQWMHSIRPDRRNLLEDLVRSCLTPHLSRKRLGRFRHLFFVRAKI